MNLFRKKNFVPKNLKLNWKLKVYIEFIGNRYSERRRKVMRG